MPLVRFALRNELQLASPELYSDAVKAEDPKPVLDGVAVAGLVGLLRQLGDLAEFASEVFHGLQEQVASTASRSRKLVTRVQRVEASLPQLEKAILSQTSHIHFAYTPGSEWHPRIRNEKNHFIYDDLPHFLMDSYEECREPPRLQLLDRFDNGGPGSCLKRYSDPTFFRRASASSELCNGEKSQFERKAHRIKKRRAWQRSGRFTNRGPNLNDGGRMPFSSSAGQRQSPLSQTGSTVASTFKSDLGEPSDSLGSKDGMGFIECVFHPSTSKRPDDDATSRKLPSRNEEIVGARESFHFDEQTANSGPSNPTMESTAPRSSSVTWDEKMEIVEPMGLSYEINDFQEVPNANSDFEEQGLKPTDMRYVKREDGFSNGSTSKFDVAGNHLKTSSDDLDEQRFNPTNMRCINQEDDFSDESTPTSNVAGHYLITSIDDLNDVYKNNFDFHEQNARFEHELLEPVNLKLVDQVDDLSEHESSTISHDGDQYPQRISDGHLMELARLDNSLVEVQEKLEDPELHIHSFQPANVESISQVAELSEGGNTSESIAAGDLINDPTDRKLGISEAQHVIETNFDKVKEESEATKTEIVGQVNGFSEDGNAVTIIEWNQLDDVDSETDHFVDALNTIESESESDFERQTRSEGLFSESKHGLVQGNTNKQNVEIMDRQETELECHPISHDLTEGVAYNSQCSTASVSSANVKPLEYAQSSCNVSAGVEGEKIVDSTCFSDEQPVEFSQSSSGPIVSKGIDLVGNVVTLCESAASDSQVSSDDRNVHAPHLSPEHPVVCSESSSTPIVSLAIDLFANREAVFEVEASESQVLPDEGNIHAPHLSLEQPVVCSQSSSEANIARDTDIFANRAAGCEFEASDSKVIPDEENIPAPHVSREQPVVCPQLSSAPNFSQGIDLFANRAAVCEVAASDSQVPCDEGNIHAPHLPREMPVGVSDPHVSQEMPVGASTPHESQETSVGPSSSYPLAFWSNGTLLGLQPSKPTVFSPSNAMSSDPSSGKDSRVLESHSHVTQEVERFAEDPASSVRDPECDYIPKEPKVDTGDQNVGLSGHVSHRISDKEHEKSFDHDKSIASDRSQSRLTDPFVTYGLNNGSVMPHGSKIPTVSHIKNVPAEATNASEDKSSLLSLLGRGLLKNGLRRSGSLGYDEKPKANMSNNLEKRCETALAHSTPEINLKGKLSSPVSSPPPSPPIEHMKISFRPIDGFDASRLKLKYPEGIDQHEMTVDAFPSFQLVPEPTNLRHDNGSDSDDDTFCCSYACMSDDYRSHLSDSNSEEWESGDTSGSNDQALYDGLRRISSTESASSSPQREETVHKSINVSSRSAGLVHLESGPSFDSQILDTNNPSAFQEMKLCLNPKEVDSSSMQQLTPQTPPLPPLQWRVSRPLLDEGEAKKNSRSDSLNQLDAKHSGSGIPQWLVSRSLLDAGEAKQDVGSDTRNQVSHAKLSRPSIPQLPNLDSAKQPSSEDSAKTTIAKKVDEQKLEPQKQNSLATNGRIVENGGDFLQQIRAKSFNLRRTGTARPAYTPTLIAATTNKVTAILQKANAIRQAVGSDGEDDSWSDT